MLVELSELSSSTGFSNNRCARNSSTTDEVRTLGAVERRASVGDVVGRVTSSIWRRWTRNRKCVATSCVTRVRAARAVASGTNHLALRRISVLPVDTAMAVLGA